MLSSSNDRSFRNGVTRAVPHPANPLNMAATPLVRRTAHGFRVVREDYFSKFMQPTLADHPLRRFQRAAREALAAACCVAQRNGVGRRVKPDFMGSGIRAGAVGTR